jgi:thiamine-phosphate diphosphorylase
MYSIKISGLYLISDASMAHGRSHEEIVAEGIAGGASVIQLREKWMSPRELYPVAMRIRALTRDAGVMLIVNDSVELALAVGADGVHLGQDDMPVRFARKVASGRLVIGVSTHSLEEARSAFEDGADYIGFGPVFRTGTKDAGEPMGPEKLRLIKDEVGGTVVAIGGIDASNALETLKAGADALAVISAVTGSEDMKRAVAEISGICRGYSA